MPIILRSKIFNAKPRPRGPISDPTAFGSPVVAIVGRPNVGKSTLFNCLTRSRDALVANEPGLTRDRQYGIGRVGQAPYFVVDTGGLTDDSADLPRLMVAQALSALSEADVTLFMVDARQGVTPLDQAIADRLRLFGTTVVLVANKVDGLDARTATAEFHTLGLGEPWPVAAAHGRGIQALITGILTADLLANRFPTESTQAISPALDRHSRHGQPDGPSNEQSAEEDNPSSPIQSPNIRVAIIGRPNVGKSTLVNRLLGEERVVVHDRPGTTRDSIEVPLTRSGKHYTLIDTAGIRRRSRISEKIEKFSIIQSLRAIDAADVAIVLVDALEGITDQDAHLIGLVCDMGRALVLGMNKWDAIAQDSHKRIHEMLERKLQFLDFLPIHTLSACHGTGVSKLFRSVDAAWASASRTLATPVLTTILQEAVAKHPPPLVRGRRIKLRYAHQGGRRPPTIVIHGNQTEDTPMAYRKYLVRVFREAMQLVGTPIRIEFKTGENPYKGRKNTLTPRQVRKRARLLRHVKN
uniref:GTPase Der n=1 Tax=Candidatus Kentrum eta TaxID=2126337 RepID=A0A450VJY5_9GAMM|nr:MAG: GTP-binding protein [Candidatus Kentron sp. H]VFK01767.1 MAG: GTP-binding protein [Candidatus Kentron sp. H]VFK05134.1 MAG: GTP-binding protein [Candidatus Kentron sp. H]